MITRIAAMRCIFGVATQVSLLTALLLGGATTASAQQNDLATLGGVTGGKVVSIPRLEAEPHIDGVLDEEVWSRAAVIDDFHQLAPFEYSAPSQRTVVRLFYTDDALFVAARMYEDEPGLITANIMRQGQGLPNDDTFNLMLDPYLDRRGGYLFEVNANGVRVEGVYQNVTQVDRNWTGIWQAQSRIDGEGWVTEIKIPFQSISFDPGNSAWGINFRRTIRRSSEEIAWVSRNRQINPSIAGTVSGLEGLRQGRGLDIVPYMVMRVERVFGPQGYTDHIVKPQLDLFYKITPQLNAAITLNTDFSATEVDDRQVNLTRFNLFFPERRDFFIRDADIFEFGSIGVGAPFGQEGNDAVPRAALQNGRPFFSRRIGLSPTGAPVDIHGGAKVSGRIGDWDVGTLIVSQDEDPTTGVGSQLVFVGRAALNVLSESQLGVIATYGNPQSDLGNSLVGTDFRYRNSNLPGGRSMEGELWYQRSDAEGVSGQDAAYGFGLRFPNNRGWRGGYRYKQIENNFAPALGFVNQTGIEDHALDFGYRHFLQQGSYVRSVYGGYDLYRNEDANTGRVISETMHMRANADNNLGDSFSVSLIDRREVLTRDFTIYRATDGSQTVVISPGSYSFTQVAAGVGFAGRRKLSGRISMNWGDYYDGDRFERGFNVSWQPVPRFSFGASYTENDIRLPQGNFTVRLTSINGLINFNSMLSWSNRIQYDNVSEGLGINSRLRWIPQAGQEGFLVLNWGLQDLDKTQSFSSVNSDLSLKFNYTFRY